MEMVLFQKMGFLQADSDFVTARMGEALAVVGEEAWLVPKRLD